MSFSRGFPELRSARRRSFGVLVFAAAWLLLGVAWAQAPETAAPLSWEQYRDHMGLTDVQSMEQTPLGKTGGYAVDALWTIVAAILVFWMQAGFALVEAGFTRAKNAVNILMKNLMDFSVGSIAYWALGFGLMFGVSNGFCGGTGFMLRGYESDTWSYTFLFFQTAFAGTAATIVSGALAERTKFVGYLLYSVVISMLIYPIFGSWAWGSLFAGGGFLEAPAGGFMDRLGLPPFIDFAGSTVVHSVGGWASLAGAIVVGPRLGKYTQGAIRGHSMTLAALGVFILWMGWFGFNAGSTTGVTGGLSPSAGAGKAIGLIAVNTNLSACAGASAAMFTIWFRVGKPEISMALNGVLAGLVSITASCATVSPLSAVLIGALGGTLVVFAVELVDHMTIDDPVGAISVHAICGVWGTLAAALFHVNGFKVEQLLSQLLGIVTCFSWTFSTTYVLFRLLRATVGLRASEEDEVDGLDISEHGGEAYPLDQSTPFTGHTQMAE